MMKLRLPLTSIMKNTVQRKHKELVAESVGEV